MKLLPRTTPRSDVSGTHSVEFWPASDAIHVNLTDTDGARRQAGWLWI